MYRKPGIDFRYPRSSGGRFFGNRIHEGMSGLSVTYFYLSPPSPPADPTTVFWEWDRQNISGQFEGPFYVGRSGTILGSVSASYEEMTSSMAAASDFDRNTGRTQPRIRFNITPGYTSALTGVAIYRLNTPALPKRFRLYVRFGMRDDSAGIATPNFGLIVNANKIDTQAQSSSLYGSMIYFDSAYGTRVRNVQTGAFGPAFLDPDLGWSSDPVATDRQEMREMTIDFSMKDLVGTTSGAVWKGEIPQEDRFRVVGSSGYVWQNRSIVNWASGTYANWTGISGTNNVYLVIGTQSSGTLAGDGGRYISIEDIAILNHPLDTE